MTIRRRVPIGLVIALAALATLHCSSSGSSNSGNANDAATSGASSGGNAGSSGSAAAGGSGTSAGGTGSSNGGAISSSGGASSSGGTVSSSGGAGPDGGAAGKGGTASSGDSGAGGSGNTKKQCKRGIAANTAPGAAFSPSIAWWYNWGSKGTGQGAGIEFTPMIWGTSHLNDALPAGSKFLLTFNEPNFFAQANLSAADAAANWPKIEARAAEQHLPIVGPAMNFCGPADQCHGTDPYQYLKDFFAACTNCKVDYVAVHWYNCDLPSLKDYLEPGGNLEGFEQFGKPIWLTEFSCNGDATVAEQETYMKAAIPYLESSSFVYRYSWFSAGPIPNAELINADGSPTDLGKVYMGLPQSCD